MTPAERAAGHNAVQVLRGMEAIIADTRRRLLKDWEDTEQTGDLAWTLLSVLEGLQKIESSLDMSLDGELADLARGEDAEVTS